MAIFSRQSLIAELLDRTELLKASVQPFLRLTDDQLLHRPAPGKWSIAEIYTHLNLSMDQTVRKILTRITLAPDHHPDEYRSSWLGDWLYGRIMPRPDGTLFKLKAIAAHSPEGREPDAREALEAFQRHCDSLDDILRHVRTKDLRRIRIPFYLNGLISLRLGDMLRFLVAHGERHLLQAQRLVVPTT
ncbi:MAG TPA: DinB family protein [Puia sp.]|uniref:DinB family protein n=1 Tax=Puia sp. TaxID=2045100 RepID=UPI002CBF3D38|nr:DinB family protein [Puia sp.]HVU95631.1 DinB family protein [Puia sp.]